jgi:tripartite-type tricarboxylate transporter receptor subunit TctC
LPVLFIAAWVALPQAASGIEMFTYFGDGSRIGLPSLEVPVEAYPGIPLRSDRLRARRRAMQAGPGSAVHVLGEAFKREAKVDMQHVGFKGAAPLKQEMLAGRIQIGGDQLSTSLAEIRAGTLRAIATTASKRVAGLPDVPTVRELGFPTLELEGWNGLFAPAKTPKDIIDRLNREVVAAVRHPDVVRRLAELGAEAVGSTPAEQDAIFRRQMEQFRPVIQEMKITD